MRHIQAYAWVVFICSVLFAAPGGRCAEETGAAAPLQIGSHLELFVDQYLIQNLNGTRLKLQEPRPAEVAIKIDRPWEGCFGAISNVFFYAGKYRMYYRAMKDVHTSFICYAESEDGIHWTKPDLGCVEVMDTKDNNAIVYEEGYQDGDYYEHGPTYGDVWLDDRPGIPADERIKLTHIHHYNEEEQRWKGHWPAGGKHGVRFLVSGDGVRFRLLSDKYVLHSWADNSFDSVNSFFWSEAEGQYVSYLRMLHIPKPHPYPEKAWHAFRWVARAASTDLLHWTTEEPEKKWTPPAIMTCNGTDATWEEIYTNNTYPYFRAPHIYIALAARFWPGRRVITPEQEAQISVAAAYAGDCSDAVLMSTRAGSTVYDRTFMESFIRPGLGYSNWVSRTNYPGGRVMETAPGEMSFYVNRDYGQATWHIRRYTLRTDGFVSVNAPYAGGELLTKPLIFEGKGLILNYATSAAGGVRVELQTPEGVPIPGFTLDDCPEIIGDEIERVVSWGEKGSDVSALAGRPVRLRFVMKDADLFSLRFR